MSLMPFLVIWVALVLVVAYFGIRRRMVASHEDDALHVSDVPHSDQLAVNRELDKIDKWGKLLTVVAVVYGLLLGVAYMYQQWVSTSKGV